MFLHDSIKDKKWKQPFPRPDKTLLLESLTHYIRIIWALSRSTLPEAHMIFPRMESSFSAVLLVMVFFGVFTS